MTVQGLLSAIDNTDRHGLRLRRLRDWPYPRRALGLASRLVDALATQLAPAMAAPFSLPEVELPHHPHPDRFWTPRDYRRHVRRWHQLSPPRRATAVDLAGWHSALHRSH